MRGGIAIGLVVGAIRRVGEGQAGYIGRRVRQAHPKSEDQLFTGRNVEAVVDVFQDETRAASCIFRYPAYRSRAVEAVDVRKVGSRRRQVIENANVVERFCIRYRRYGDYVCEALANRRRVLRIRFSKRRRRSAFGR